MGATAGQRSEADHEEVKTREGNHVDGELAKIRVKLTRETQAGGNTGHDGRDEVVQVTVRGVGKLEGLHADVVQGLVVNAEGLIGVLDKLVDGEGGVVRLNNGIGRAWRRKDGEGGHHAVRELLTDLGDQQSTHTGTGTTTEGVSDLETLEAVAALGLTADDIEDLVDELSTLSVVSLGPVVASTGLTKDEVVGTEELTEGTGTNGLHGTRLKIDEDGAGNILVARSLCQIILANLRPFVLDTSVGVANLVEVDAHALELKLGSAIVDTVAVETVLAGDGLPESSTDLVTLFAEEKTRSANKSTILSLVLSLITYALTGLKVNLFRRGKKRTKC